MKNKFIHHIYIWKLIISNQILIEKYQHLKYKLTVLIAPTMLQNSSFVSSNLVHSTFDNIQIKR
jgi:hypothetical protein